MKKLILLCVFTLLATTNIQAGDEGIKVHGHWQFDIYNKDGSFDRKVEFENALTTNGKDTLIRLLLGTNAEKWRVSIEGGLCDGLPVGDCNLFEQSGVDGLSSFYNNITVTSTVDDEIVLTGSLLSPNTASIDGVTTFLHYCTGLPTTPGTCDGTTVVYGNSFTSKDLSASPVPIQAGQTVNVTVTISFS